jgi:hypothetical protein
MRKKGLLFVSIIISSALIVGLFIINPSFNYLSDYLEKSEKVKANILIVEGWLPENALEMTYSEFRKNGYDYIITTGLQTPINYYGLFSNGFLVFYSKNSLSGINENGLHSIEIDAFSELGGDNRAHFNLFINDSLTAEFYVEKKENKYQTNWKGSLNNIDSIMVQFDNDSWGDFGDRNLFVKDINIDHKITIPNLNKSESVVLKVGRERSILNNFNSNAELSRYRLISMGIDSSQIKATPGKRVNINRTLTSALSFRDWLKTTKIEIKGINIISLGAHTRRTWMIYNRILHKKYEIGIISLPDYHFNHSRSYRILKTVRETLGIIYYWFILIPY